MTDTKQNAEMQQVLDQTAVTLPEVGTVVEGVVVSAANNEVYVDIGGIATGVVRGPELIDESGLFTNLQPGDPVMATVLEDENEIGVIELSFREAGHQKAWENLAAMMRDKEIVQGQILEANKGGLIVRFGNVTGFLPVSQLTVEHYPRVEGANKAKILQRLQTYIGETFTLRIIDVVEAENKLIFSEKAAKLDEQSSRLSHYTVGDVVEGKVSGVVDFGAFVEFDNGLEGLVHISELAWQRIDNPRDVIDVGQPVKVQIIGIDNGKISLSMRRLQDDPWKNITTKFQIGSVVKGKVLKLNSFGAFVELTPDIHGLAHISELSWKKVYNPEQVLKVGQSYDFKVVSIEPAQHRLGLSLKQLQPKPVADEQPTEPTVDNSVEPVAETPSSTEPKPEPVAQSAEESAA